MKCHCCDGSATLNAWVRPKEGGRMRLRGFCSDECKVTGMQALDEEGLKEAQCVLGWDVFIPWWQRLDI